MATQKQSVKSLASLHQQEAMYRSLESGNNQVKAKKIDATKVLLELQKGEFSSQEAWFVKDENNQEYVMIPEALLKNIVQTIRKAYEDKLKVELERDIATHTPIDFEDVMAVAVKKLETFRKSDGSLPRIDTHSFVEQIKKEHPNLFFDLDDYFRKQKSFNQ
ncbi:hypothetical protein BKH41_07720 [Helicobacter sp. 12S02232-10]|uniref:DUF2603 domain-containing protein n=1 Tax=Helicobacter sp. 12S02232-10 TaxID=1476197 RepID=UPI000BA73D9C|nr:DUF2603 domain-containing protein [Helicobacter sp. 12S02232-10]PAF47457.1 hypothetical protein BKH41_07720 [Helicobacter sp. 12S02232-10]